MRSLFHITQEFQEIRQLLINSDGELTPELESKLLITSSDFDKKAANYGLLIREFLSKETVIDIEIKRLQALKKSAKKSADRLKDTMRDAMVSVSYTHLTLPTKA